MNWRRSTKVFIKTVSAAGVAVALIAPAGAEVTPRNAGYDAHIQNVVYNPLDVVLVRGSLTNSTQIILQVGEEIKHIAIGDADSWLAQPVGNMLFIKPLGFRLSTNMQVVTLCADRSLRSYQFRLLPVRRGERGVSHAMYAIRFHYPDDAENTRSDVNRQRAAAAIEKAAMTKLARAWAEGPRNWRYVAQGSARIEPKEVSDNGRQTAFRFPGNMRVPTIYTLTPDGTESIAPYTMIEDKAVLQTTAREFMLRDGREVLRIVNQGFDPVGRNPGTGTGLSELTRTLRVPAP